MEGGKKYWESPQVSPFSLLFDGQKIFNALMPFRQFFLPFKIKMTPHLRCESFRRMFFPFIFNQKQWLEIYLPLFLPHVGDQIDFQAMLFVWPNKPKQHRKIWGYTQSFSHHGCVYSICMNNRLIFSNNRNRHAECVMAWEILFWFGIMWQRLHT